MSFTLAVAAALVATALAAAARPSAQGADPRRVRDPSPAWALTPLPWGSVRPGGWILDWADAARKGAVSPQSGWFAAGNGKNGRTNGWLAGRPKWAMDEQSAYWIDGMMRLGLVLGDEALLARAREDIAAAVRKRAFDDAGTSGWPRTVYSRAMLAHLDATGDPAVLPFFEAAWHPGYTMDPPADSRSVTQCEAMLEGYAFGGSPTLRDVCLQGLEAHEAPFLHAWVDSPCKDFAASSQCFNSSFETEHGVTWNEIAKLFATASGWTEPHGNRSDRYLAASRQAYEQLAARDLLPHGVNSAEEALSGIAPNASTETCDVSDFIHSSTWLLRATGEGRYGDRMERAFHNAAPAAVSRNWTRHAYFQAPNLATIPHDVFRLPGVRYRMQEAHDPPCCTGNQARLLPNYIHHMWMSTQDADGTLGLAAAMYGPSSAEALVGPPGAASAVRINVTTAYPFDTRIHIQVRLVGASTSLSFPLSLRVPSWCARPSLTVAGAVLALRPDSRGFHVVRRAWADGDSLELELPMEPVLELGRTVNNGGITGSDGYGNGNRNNYVVGGLPFATVSLGPLLFALPLEQGRDWQYALEPDGPLRVVREPLPSAPWDWPLESALKVIVPARRIQWPDVWQLPSRPVQPWEPDLGNSTVELELVPYGCTKVFRVSMFPYVGRASAAPGVAAGPVSFI